MWRNASHTSFNSKDEQFFVIPNGVLRHSKIVHEVLNRCKCMMYEISQLYMCYRVYSDSIVRKAIIYSAMYNNNWSNARHKYILTSNHLYSSYHININSEKLKPFNQEISALVRSNDIVTVTRSKEDELRVNFTFDDWHARGTKQFSCLPFVLFDAWCCRNKLLIVLRMHINLHRGQRCHQHRQPCTTCWSRFGTTSW